MKHSASSSRTSVLTVMLLCAAAMVPSARAAGRTLAQVFTACEDYSGYEGHQLVDTRELRVPAQDFNTIEMGGGSGIRFFVVATAQDSSTFDIDIYDAAYDKVTGGNSETTYVGCYDGSYFDQTVDGGMTTVDVYCKNSDSPCPVRLDLWSVVTLPETASALPPGTSNLDQGSNEPAIDPAFEAPAEPDALTPVPEPVSSPSPNPVPSSSTPSSVSVDATWEDSSSSGISIGVIVGCAVGGVVLIAAIAGLAFWLYKRRQRLASIKLEVDIGGCVPEKAIEPVNKGEMEEASSETSEVVVDV